MRYPQRSHDRTKRTIYDVTKVYPEFVKVIRFNISFDVSLGAKAKPNKDKTKPSFLQKVSDDRAGRRAKTTIHDLVLCNNFDMFITLTFDPKKVKNRYDLSVLKLMSHRWLEKQRKEHGRFGYVFVAEQHQDGAIHFHGLFQNFKGRLAPRANFDPENPVYNVSAWPYGKITMAKPIKQTDEDKHRVAAYVSKYISKDMVRFAGNKRFWVSQDLIRPEKMVNDYYENSTSEIYCAT